MAMSRSALKPNPQKGYEFVNAIVGGAIPKEYIGPAEQGIKGAMLSGVLAGFNVVDVKVTLYDGSYHEVDSSEMASKSLVPWRLRKQCARRPRFSWSRS